MDDSEFLRSKSDSCQRQIATYDLRVALKAPIKWVDGIYQHTFPILITLTDDFPLNLRTEVWLG